MIAQGELRAIYRMSVEIAELSADYERLRLGLLERQGEKVEKGPWLLKYIARKGTVLRQGWQDLAKHRLNELDSLVPAQYRKKLMDWSRRTFRAMMRPSVSVQVAVKYAPTRKGGKR